MFIMVHVLESIHLDFGNGVKITRYIGIFLKCLTICKATHFIMEAYFVHVVTLAFLLLRCQTIYQ